MGCGASLDGAKSIARVDNNVWKGCLKLKVNNADLVRHLNFIGGCNPYCVVQFGK